MSSLGFITNLLSGPGLILIMAVLLLFGAKRLPELGKSLGETMRELTKNRDNEKEDEDPKADPNKRVPPKV